VFDEVAGHPVVFAAGQALDSFTPVAAQEGCSALAGGADQAHRKARLEGQGDERGLAVAGYAFDADVLCVHGGIGFEVIEGAGGAPLPGAERTPVFGLAGLGFVDEGDDAAGESGSVVGLDACGADGSVTPAIGEELLGRRERTTLGAESRER